MCLRVAVRAVESWLLADRESLATFLGVPQARIPEMPEMLDDPKQTIVDLARRSRRRMIREDMVPRPDSGARVGPAYPTRIIEYAQGYWRPDEALAHADSLRRFVRRLQELLAGSAQGT